MILLFRWDCPVFSFVQTLRVELLNSSEQVLLKLNGRDLLKFEPLGHVEEANAVCCGCFPIKASGKKKNRPKGFYDDSQPDGPSAVGLDLTFPACDGLYGLPERSSFTHGLRDTTAGDPYRLYNADVYDYEVVPIGSPQVRVWNECLLACN